MKTKHVLPWLILPGAILLALVIRYGKPLTAGWLHSQTLAHLPMAGPVAHAESSFEFTVHAPYESVVPLFGAHEERRWGGDAWNPEFLYPSPASDKLGEVFTVNHGGSRSTWVNTAFDLTAGHIQYVYIVPDSVAVLIDIHVKRADSATTSVKVGYQHTALRPESNAHVNEVARAHGEMGPHWAKALEECLKR